MQCKRSLHWHIPCNIIPMTPHAAYQSLIMALYASNLRECSSTSHMLLKRMLVYTTMTMSPKELLHATLQGWPSYCNNMRLVSLCCEHQTSFCYCTTLNINQIEPFAKQSLSLYKLLFCRIMNIHFLVFNPWYLSLFSWLLLPKSWLIQHFLHWSMSHPDFHAFSFSPPLHYHAQI